jgi:L-fuculose-phosphate aldolase
MNIQESKETVILAGKRLVESGLIARTWGNVSCRISDSHFVITPSGRDYLSLTTDEIVEVAISDCSYSGNIKPSSEKRIHAEVYKLHPEVNFVIHTHQNNASFVSVLDMDTIDVSNKYHSLCGEVVCAAYGLPGTKKLRGNVAEALAVSKGKAVIMKNHGALCFGIDYEETFKVTQELEAACEDFIRDKSLEAIGKSGINPKEIGCLALSKFTRKTIERKEDYPLFSYESERTENGFKLNICDKTFDIESNQPESTIPSDSFISSEVKIHNEIYKNNTNINNIIHANTTGILDVSCAGIKLLPLLDDFAQIAGTSVKTVEMDASKISAILKGAPAVFVQGNGALCCGISRGDALAVSLVTEKNCKALIGAALLGKIKYINPFECILMRFIYLKKYSKRAYNK